MKPNATLTKREAQVAERIAWGSSGKEVAYDLNIKYKTVDNIIQRVKKKIGVGKINEISAWWFCTRFGISFDLSPMARAAVASVLLSFFLITEFYPSDNYCRYGRESYKVHRTLNIRIRHKDN